MFVVISRQFNIWYEYFNVQPGTLLERERPNSLLLLNDCLLDSNTVVITCTGCTSHWQFSLC